MIMSVKEYFTHTGHMLCVIGNSEEENVEAIKKEFLKWDFEQLRGHGFEWDCDEIFHREVEIGKVEVL
tara:strand:- start:605 stop:808 length:204 start_codon:yes stop_codon:yes gene_type:complete